MSSRADGRQLTPDDIYSLFEKLNEKLRVQGIRGSILLCGGAVMTSVYHSRNSTQDVDAVFTPSEPIRQAVSEIAEEEGLAEDWLNDGVKGFIDTKRLGYDEYVILSNLDVFSLDAESMLATKLASARTDTDRDVKDSLTLMHALEIQSIDELYRIVTDHIDKSMQTAAVNFFIQYVFDLYKNGTNESNYI